MKKIYIRDVKNFNEDTTISDFYAFTKSIRKHKKIFLLTSLIPQAVHHILLMGVERLIRWLMAINHVRDAHPFPRIFGRKILV